MCTSTQVRTCLPREGGLIPPSEASRALPASVAAAARRPPTNPTRRARNPGRRQSTGSTPSTTAPCTHVRPGSPPLVSDNKTECTVHRRMAALQTANPSTVTVVATATTRGASSSSTDMIRDRLVAAWLPLEAARLACASQCGTEVLSRPRQDSHGSAPAPPTALPSLSASPDGSLVTPDSAAASADAARAARADRSIRLRGGGDVEGAGECPLCLGPAGRWTGFEVRGARDRWGRGANQSMLQHGGVCEDCCRLCIDHGQPRWFCLKTWAVVPLSVSRKVARELHKLRGCLGAESVYNE